jgi:hypothetical protein
MQPRMKNPAVIIPDAVTRARLRKRRVDRASPRGGDLARGAAALVLWIATANLFNRLNATTKQVVGSWR